MKLEMDVTKPGTLIEQWPGQYSLFSWMEYVTAIPQPIFLITTLKENGKPNVCLHAWSTFTGEGDNFFCIISILKHQHTYHNIIRNGEFCINFPDSTMLDKCFDTIKNNAGEDDEISKSGFTIEAAGEISAPRIKECFLAMECSLEWEKPVYENSTWVLLCGRVKHLAMEEDRLKAGIEGRYGPKGYFYNIHAPKNPVDGSEIKDSIGIIDVLSGKG